MRAFFPFVRQVQWSFAIGIIAAAFGWYSCGGSSSSPSPTGNSSIAGTVTDAATQTGLAGATVSVQGKSVTTAADGRYSIAGLADGSATLTSQHQGHRNVTQAVTIAAATTRNVVMTVAPEVRASGPWTGTWTSQSGASGNINMTLAVNTMAQTMTITLTVNGPAFGRTGPLTDTITGSYSPTTGASFTTTSSIFGTVTFMWPPSVGISGSAVNVPGGLVSRADFRGELDSPDIDLILTLNGDLTFTNGTKGSNQITLTCVRQTSRSNCS